MTDQEKQTILCDNIRVFTRREELAIRQRALSLSELTECLLTAEKETEAEPLYRLFLRSLPQASVSDRAFFCARIAKHPYHGKRLSESGSFGKAEVSAPGSHGRITFVRNRYTEKAFSLFSYAVIGAKSSYAASFPEACEAVYDNRCEFCILPIENTENGRLFAFYAMLDRYELRICAACDLENDNDSVIRYALIGKKTPERLLRQEIWHFEFSIAAEPEHFPTDLLPAATVFQASPVKLDSLPVQYDDGLQRFYFTFRINRTEAFAFDLYLTEEHSGYTPIGLYPLLISH